MSEDVPIPPTIAAATEVVRDFLRLAVDIRDPAAARTLMTEDSVHVPMFDPAGLVDKRYAIGEPVSQADAVIVPVTLTDGTSLEAVVPLVVVLEGGSPRIDVRLSVETMMGAQIQFVGPEDGDGPLNPSTPDTPP